MDIKQEFEFGTIKNAFNNLLSESLYSKDKNNKTLFVEYVRTIKKSPILKTQFFVYSNIETKQEKDYNKALEYVKENLALLSNFTKEDIKETNKKLSNKLLLNEDIKITDLHSDIATIIFNEKSIDTIEKIVESTDRIVKFIQTNEKKIVHINEDLTPTVLLGSLLVDKFNEQYDTLSEDERIIFKTIIESNDTEKETIYLKLINECVELVNDNLKISDLIDKEKLLNVKEKLLIYKTNISEHFEENISNLLTLKQTLENKN